MKSCVIRTNNVSVYNTDLQIIQLHEKITIMAILCGWKILYCDMIDGIKMYS